ncbi:MAG: hypothetical protein EOO63_13535 [Hymenobacter sp.]|nr:MAG: hypothetical protein EOO63_13535 [Hymenobacter sp.]
MRTVSWCFCFLLLANGVVSCAESERTSLAGRYYSSYTEDGDTGLYFDDPQTGPIELKYSYAVGVAKGYVVSCGDSCYLFPVAAETVEAARRAQIGPFTWAACKKKVFQLTGDSLELKSLIER